MMEGGKVFGEDGQEPALLLAITEMEILPRYPVNEMLDCLVLGKMTVSCASEIDAHEDDQNSRRLKEGYGL